MAGVELEGPKAGSPDASLTDSNPSSRPPSAPKRPVNLSPRTSTSTAPPVSSRTAVGAPCERYFLRLSTSSVKALIFSNESAKLSKETQTNNPTLLPTIRPRMNISTRMYTNSNIQQSTYSLLAFARSCSNARHLNASSACDVSASPMKETVDVALPTPFVSNNC